MAQLVEQRTVNPFVPGSSPGRGATYSEKPLIISISGFLLSASEYFFPLHEFLQHLVQGVTVLGTNEFPNGMHEKLRHTDIQRSEEHTSELQSRPHLVCRLL